MIVSNVGIELSGSG